MRTVRDEEGNQYLLVKQSEDAWLVKDPTTDEEHYLPAETLSSAEKSPLALAATAIPDPVRLLLRACPTDEAIGLVVELGDRGPIPTRTLLGTSDRCESDLHGLLGELKAAGVITETEVAGQPGYELTPVAEHAVTVLQDTDPAPE